MFELTVIEFIFLVVWVLAVGALLVLCWKTPSLTASERIIIGALSVCIPFFGALIALLLFALWRKPAPKPGS